MARNRTMSADRRERSRDAATARMPGLRWVPVPLAILMAALGWLIFGSVAGQHALAVAHGGPEQGGMGLTVNQALWMQDDMANQGNPGGTGTYQMPQSMMPGMQTSGDKRLRVELYLRNISNQTQVYGLAEFRLLGTGKHSWSPLDNAATRGAPLSAKLYAGFQATTDLYFDLPASATGPFSLEWEHDGHLMTIPIHIGNSMVGM
jgi:hypothetical protein